MKLPVNHNIASRLKRRSKRNLVDETVLQSLFAHHVDGVVLVDASAVVRFVNQAAEKILGKESPSLLGAEFEFPLTVGTTTRLNTKKQGLERIVADLQVVPTQFDGSPAYIANLRDVSELVRAEEAERQKGKALEALARIGAILVQDRQINIKCTEALEVLTEVVQADFSTIRVREGQDQALRLVAQSGSGRISERSAISAHRSAVAEALKTEAPIILNNYPSDSLADPMDVKRGIKSAVVLPIRSAGQVAGLISVVAKTEGHFTIERIEILTSIRSALGVVLENVSLSEQLDQERQKRRRAEQAKQEAENRIRDLRDLMDVVTVGQEPERGKRRS